MFAAEDWVNWDPNALEEELYYVQVPSTGYKVSNWGKVVKSKYEKEHSLQCAQGKTGESKCYLTLAFIGLSRRRPCFTLDQNLNFLKTSLKVAENKSNRRKTLFIHFNTSNCTILYQIV